MNGKYAPGAQRQPVHSVVPNAKPPPKVAISRGRSTCPSSGSPTPGHAAGLTSPPARGWHRPQAAEALGLPRKQAPAVRRRHAKAVVVPTAYRLSISPAERTKRRGLALAGPGRRSVGSEGNDAGALPHFVPPRKPVPPLRKRWDGLTLWVSRGDSVSGKSGGSGAGCRPRPALGHREARGVADNRRRRAHHR